MKRLLISALMLQGLGILLNYAFITQVAIMANNMVAGKIFWYLNIIFCLTMFSIWGGEAWIVKLANRADANRLYIYRLGFKLVGTLTILSSMALFIYSYFIEKEPIYFSLLIIICFILYLFNFFSSVILESEKKPKTAVVARLVSPYIFSSPLIYFLGQNGLSINLALTAWSFSCLVSILCYSIGNKILFSGILNARDIEKISLAQGLKNNVNYFLASFFAYLFFWHSIFVSKFFLTYAELAEFNYFMKIVSLITLPMLVIGVIFAPRIASANTLIEKWHVYKTSCIISAGLAFIPFMIIITFSNKIASFLGENYSGGNWVIYLAVMQLVSMVFGAQVTMMIMTDLTNQLTKIIIIFTIISIITIFFIAEEYGVIGISLTLMSISILKLLTIHYTLINNRE